MAPEQLNQVLAHLEPDRREFFRRVLAGAVWAAPLVASFSLEGLLEQPAAAQGTNICAVIAGANVNGPAVAIQKTAPSQVQAGEPITYMISVENCTSASLPTVSFVDPLPVGTTFLSASQVAGSPSWSLTTPPVGSGGTVQGSIAHLGAADGAQFQIVVQSPPQ